MNTSHNQKSIWIRYGYLWVTFILFLGSIVGHWLFAWQAFVNEQESNNEPVLFEEYFVEVMRDTFENWQSEFLQLIWQVAGLALLWCVGSPQSKEGDERKEEKLDYLLRGLYGKNAESILKDLDEKYPAK